VSTEEYELIGTRFLEEEIDYDGRQLRSHFVRESAGLKSDAVVAFIGRCDVRGDSLVDLEDSERGETIVASRMLHFIGEHFSISLREGNVRLRLLVSTALELLAESLGKVRVRRDGDDLFADDRKLSVAICTKSAVSVIFHLGIDIDPAGAPVPAIGLEELGIEPSRFARTLMDRYQKECSSIELALRKVRGVD
jgi:hypothetical protein